MLNKRMEALCEHKKHSFVGYVTAGWPNREDSLRIVRNCCAAGLDILEAGFPAADPSCDGGVIRQAQKEVDKSLVHDLSYWRLLRQEVTVPIWLMGYRNDLVESGAYLRMAQEGLYDALVLPDAFPGERARLSRELDAFGVSVVGFINPLQNQGEVLEALAHTELVYHQLYCGPTGVAHSDRTYLPLLHFVRGVSTVKLYAGFGISTLERAAELLDSGYDGVIVGSAIMKKLLEDEEEAYGFIRQISACVKERETPCGA